MAGSDRGAAARALEREPGLGAERQLRVAAPIAIG
jgi:hypothetical protein